MRIAVFGSGGLGGFYGGLLARAGEDVSFIARGRQLEALRSQGLTVKSTLVGDFSLPARATDSPAEVGPVDLLIVGVKSYDLEEASAHMQPMVGGQTMVLPLQNGIDATPLLATVLGVEHVLVGVAYVSAFIESPGVIHHTALNAIHLGEQSPGVTPRVAQVAETLRHAGYCD
jgi:2-dehydropantoate 2-reductase